MGSPVELRGQRSVAIAFTLSTKLRIEALETILQQPAPTILEKAIQLFVAALPEGDRKLVESLAARALESIEQSSCADLAERPVRVYNTVSGKQFKYRGSLDDGIEVLFERSRLLITRKSIERIRDEIELHKGPVLMGAIFSPLMPNSIGEAIHKKYKLTPINLSYVVPLLCERGVARTFKEGRNWYVAAAESPRRPQRGS